MSREWNVDLEEMKSELEKARKEGHARLFAIAFERETPVQWNHSKDEKSMQEFLDSREESESILFNCAIAIVVVNPQDSDETIQFVIADKQIRRGSRMGYFEESF